MTGRMKCWRRALPVPVLLGIWWHSGVVSGVLSTCSLHHLHRKLPAEASVIHVSSNQLVRIACREGYLPRDEQVLQCTSGHWNSTGNCTVLSCGHPLLLVNASVWYSKTIYRAVAVYVCADGLILKGPQKRHCTANATWDGAGQLCAPPPPVSRSALIAIVVITVLLFLGGVFLIAGVECYRRHLFPNASTISKRSNFSIGQFSSAGELANNDSDHHIDSISREAIEPYAQTRGKLINTARSSLLPETVQTQLYAEINDRNAGFHSAWTGPYAEIGVNSSSSNLTPSRPYAEEIASSSDPLYESLDFHKKDTTSSQIPKSHHKTQTSLQRSPETGNRACDFIDNNNHAGSVCADETDAAVARYRSFGEDTPTDRHSQPHQQAPVPVTSQNMVLLSPEELDKLYAKPSKRRTNFTVI